MEDGLLPDDPLGDLAAREVLRERLGALSHPRREGVLDADRHLRDHS